MPKSLMPAEKLTANQAEPENQAGHIPGPDHVQKKNFKIFFQKIKPNPLLVQHVKEQPGSSTYVRKKGVPLVTLIVGHPVSGTTKMWSKHFSM